MQKVCWGAPLGLILVRELKEAEAGRWRGGTVILFQEVSRLILWEALEVRWTLAYTRVEERGPDLCQPVIRY